ncbi:MAG: HEAT repeat domain-containing protein [Planctomycetota bacterium]|jgi:HEAT repeat protein
MDRPSRSFLAWTLLLLVAGVAAAHNGEYKPPQATGRLRPTTGVPRRDPTATPAGRRKADPTATPESVARSRPLDWEAVWELVRRAEPAPPPAASAGPLAAARRALERALGDESGEVRALAALALGRQGELDAVLAALPKDPGLLDSPGLLGPGIAAARRGDAEASARVLRAVRTLLEDPEVDAYPRSLAALCAGLTGREAGSPILRSLSGVRHPEVRAACLLALGFSRHPGAREILLSSALPPKKGADRPDDPELRAIAVHALSLLPGEEAIADVVRRLGDPSPVVRAAAAMSLGPRLPESAGALGALRTLAGRDDPLPRSAALLALCRAGDESAESLARSVLRERAARESGLGSLAALCLGLLRSATDGPTLLTLVEDTNAPDELRAACALAAGLAKARGGAKRLRAVRSKSKDVKLAGYGMVGLALLEGEEATAFVTKRLSREKRAGVRRLAMTALGRAGGEEAAAALVVALGDDYRVNREAALALYRVDPDRAVEQLLERLADAENAHARRFATISLGAALDEAVPSRFAETVLGTALSLGTFPERLFLYLENEDLHGR